MEAYLGEIRLFSGPFVPGGWQACDGTLLGIPEHEALYSLIGTSYGGDGIKDFGVPNLDGRVPIGFGKGYVISRTGGEVEITLSPAEIPAHTHPMQASKRAATKATPEGNAATTLLAAPNTTGDTLYLKPSATPTTKPLLAPGSVGNAGGGRAHSNLMPTFALRYMIATTGEYPNFKE